MACLLVSILRGLWNDSCVWEGERRLLEMGDRKEAVCSINVCGEWLPDEHGYSRIKF